MGEFSQELLRSGPPETMGTDPLPTDEDVARAAADLAEFHQERQELDEQQLEQGAQ